MRWRRWPTAVLRFVAHLVTKARRPLLRSLWLQMIAAFGFVIILAVILIGWSANWITNREFDALVQEEARMIADNVTVLVEAHYNAANGWDKIETLFAPPEFDPAASTEIIDVSGERAPYYVPLIDEAWDRVIATQLNLSPSQYDQLRQESSIFKMALERQVSVETLVTAVMQLELSRSANIALEERVFSLMNTRYIVEDYIYSSPEWLYEGISIDEFAAVDSPFFVGTLFGNERILITDTDGQVIFDSGGVEEGRQLSTFADQKAAVHDWRSDRRVVGYVIVAAGEGYYFDKQSMFLMRVTKSLIVGGLLAISAALIVGVMIARRMTAPIAALTEAATQLAASGSTHLLPVKSTDELGRMSAAFNQMTQALAEQKMLRQRLVSDVSHELNTPLSIIQLESKGLQNGLQEPAEAAVHIQKEVTLLRNLVQDLSLLAETDQANLVLAREIVVAAAFLADVATRWQSRVEAQEIALLLKKPPELPKIEIDPVRMGQVMGNLIRNAIQHTPPGGTITLSAEQTTLPDSEQKWVVLTVRDTGEGIPAEDLPYIFERFYRVDSARQREGSGRGLGLAIVKQLVEQHNGRVRVESALNQGSAFHIYLI